MALWGVDPSHSTHRRVRSIYRLKLTCFFFQAEDGIRDLTVTGVQTCALPIYLFSAALSLVAVLLVIYGLKRIAEHGLGWVAALAIVTGLVVGIVFLRRQRALAHPLIDLHLFRSRAFSAALAVYLLGTLVVFGAYIFIAQYLQLVLGLSPLAAGLWTLPSMAAFIVGSVVVPLIARRVRPWSLITAGLVLAAVGFAVLTQVDGADALRAIVIGSVIYSLGFSPVVILATDLIVGSAPVERAGAASAISETKIGRASCRERV